MTRNKAVSSSSSSSGHVSGNVSSSSTKSPNKQSQSTRTHRKSSSTCSVGVVEEKTATTTTTTNRRGNQRDEDTTEDGRDYDIGVSSKTTAGSVHKQNLYIVSYPIIFLFNILRSLIYQLFCIFRYLYGASTKVIYRPHKRECNIEIVVGRSKNAQNAILSTTTNINELVFRGADNNKEKQVLVQANSDFSVSSCPVTSTGLLNNTQRYQVTTKPTTMSSSPGPGDPLLAKQKHHHRRAFEYISKALKIDEENEGKSILFLFSLIITTLAPPPPSLLNACYLFACIFKVESIIKVP